MSWPKGKPRPENAGRKKGTPNKKTQAIQDILDRMGCNVFEGMAKIAMGRIPCGTCHGKGKTPVKALDGTHYDRVCESCYGSLLEKVTPQTRANMYAELAQYIAPKRKAIEHTGADGGPLNHKLEVEFVKPKT